MAINDALDAPQKPTLRKGDVDGFRVDMTDYLRSTETISSVTSVTVTGVSTGAITVASAAASTGALTILGQSVGAGQAITFNVTVASTATVGTYEATIKAVTSDSRTGHRRVAFTVVG
tara:strand:+ start:644 stop:997 length:354 start_codon:yes stop_codon:yes gene_type:complete